MFNLCAPAIIYLLFSITQILIDLYNGMYNTAFMKVIVASMVTLLLNILCEKGLSVVSWIIVFIPFILMTVIVSVLLYFFGLDASTGTLDYTCKDRDSINRKRSLSESKYPENVKTDSNGNIIIYDPEFNPYIRPVRYEKPNIIVPNPHANDIYRHNDNHNLYGHEFRREPSVPRGSSSPEYNS